ncbi:response regulator transcription factor [Hymenobacter ginsengisoli]|uniref:Response regulator transcription factor n=1 Tax=Hymenobacter ginsengisoli TaxID=1051626 RepID=A0ABP8QMA6_9BACT|nr:MULTISPECIES: response regulator transcription factor [unclassified Hymenobacter]MBO2033127.1 response regulator transcription factor [Hymenobacter sp. BT559]
MEKTRISVVEDLPDIREGLRFLLNQTTEFTCLAAYASAEEALADLRPGCLPELVIMDISLPGLSGIECIRQAKRRFPAVEFVVFTVFEDSEQVFAALAAGASGYLLKRTPPHKLVDALVELRDGGSPMSASIARKLVATFQPAPAPAETPGELSPREHDVLAALAKGLLYKEIGAKLGISVHTVRQHIHRIYQKLHVQNRTEALNKFFDR